jgi:3-methyladenine DNA glycosylase AlkD
MRRVVTAAVRGTSGLDREAAVAWAAELWREPVHERRMAAVEVLRLARPQLRADDLATVEALIREARTWALVDSLAGAIGWVLRETSKRDPQWVTAWTAAHAREMSGVTFREATRRLPPATAGHLRALREEPPR